MYSRKITGGLAAVALLAGFIGQANTQTGADLGTTVVEAVSVPRIFRLDGVVEAVNKSTISAQTGGQVESILFDVDDFVEKDALLVVLKDTEQRAALSEAEAGLKGARAQLQDALSEYERIKGIYDKKLVAKSDMDKATASLESARARKDSAEAALERAREQLNYTRITAPYTGIVTARHVEPGEVAQPGQPLMSGISLNQLRVTVDVPQNLVSAVRSNGKAHVQRPDGGWIEVSRLTVFPYADPDSNTFKVRLMLEEGSGDFFPGMYVKAGFVTGMVPALVVPADAVVYRSEVTGVYVVDAERKVSFRHVRLGNGLGDGRIRVLAGLEQGEQVAIDPIAAGVMLKHQRGRELASHD